MLAATLHVLDKYFPPFRRALAYLRVHPRPRGRGRVTKLLDKAGHLNEDVFESSSELGSSVVEHVRGPRGAHRPPSVDGDGSQNHAGGGDGVQLITSPGESFDIGGGSSSSGFGRTQLSPAFAAGEGMVSTPGSRRRNLMSRFHLRRGRSTASTGTSVKAGSAAAGPSRGSSATGRSPMGSMPPLPVSENVFMPPLPAPTAAFMPSLSVTAAAPPLLAPVHVEEQPSLAASTFGSVVELARLRAAAAAMDDEAEGPAPATAATGERDTAATAGGSGQDVPSVPEGAAAVAAPVAPPTGALVAVAASASAAPGTREAPAIAPDNPVAVPAAPTTGGRTPPGADDTAGDAFADVVLEATADHVRQLLRRARTHRS